MMSVLKMMVDELAKKAKTAPGWGPLLAVCYILFQLVPKDAAVMGIALLEHKELIVAAATLILYAVGDALDKPAFKRLEPQRVGSSRSDARSVLKVGDGSYRVAKALAVAAKKYDGSWIQVKNESSKLLRSFIVPSLLLSLGLLCRTTGHGA